MNEQQQKRMQQLLRDTNLMLVRNQLMFESTARVQGLVGITVDDKHVFLVDLSYNFYKDENGQVLDKSMEKRTQTDRPVTAKADPNALPAKQFRQMAGMPGMAGYGGRMFFRQPSPVVLPPHSANSMGRVRPMQGVRAPVPAARKGLFKSQAGNQGPPALAQPKGQPAPKGGSISGGICQSMDLSKQLKMAEMVKSEETQLGKQPSDSDLPPEPEKHEMFSPKPSKPAPCEMSTSAVTDAPCEAKDSTIPNDASSDANDGDKPGETSRLSLEFTFTSL